MSAFALETTGKELANAIASMLGEFGRNLNVRVQKIEDAFDIDKALRHAEDG